MRWKILVLSILVTMAAVAASAEVKVTIGHEPLELGSGSPPELDPSVRASTQREGGLAPRAGAHDPTPAYIFPHYRIDTVNPFGDTTLLAVRNEDSSSNLVTIEINDAAWNVTTTLTKTLARREVWTLNLRDWTSAIPVDGDGYRRGWGYVRGGGGKDVSVDWFQVNPDQDFAVGGIAADISGSPAEDFCNSWKIRSLIGGGFSGGTTITFMLNTPTCQPSGNVYTETGSHVLSLHISPDGLYSFTIDASAFTSVDSTSVEIDFSSCGGAWVGVVHDAEGRYSVGVDGICLD